MLTTPLYPYQEPAVDLFLDRGSLLVAYEMGLGKTPIAIACAEELLGCRDIRLCLLVVPASLRWQWAAALAKFTDLPTTTRKLKDASLVVPRSPGLVLVEGTAAKRADLLRQAQAEASDYVIVSYETVQSDTRLIKRLKPGLVVLDEAGAIKNFGADRTRKVKTTLMSEFRLALTGTPVENKPEEAFSIMEWVDPDVLGDEDLFERAYIERNKNGTVKRYKNTKLLHHKLRTGMVRRSRKDPEVAVYLPEVDHDQWYVDLDKASRDTYEVMSRDLLEQLQAVRGNASFDMAAYYAGHQQFDEMTGVGKVMARMGAIELLLDHPMLVQQSADLYEKSLEAQEDDPDASWGGGSKYCYEFDEPLPTTQPKLDYLLARLSDILAYDANKVLVFSRYPELLRRVHTLCQSGSVVYHGGLSGKAKSTAIAQFTSDKDCRVFLSSHAGAYGTDMHMANYLINYDLPWSGGTWDQINGRHQRVSSEFGKVYIRDIIMNDTIEVRKLAVLKHKLRVAQAVVDGQSPSSGRIDNDLVSLTDFLQQR